MQFIRNNSYDVVFLQDTHLTDKSTTYFNSLWKGNCYHSCHTNRSRGVCILMKHSLHHELVKVEQFNCGNFICVICKIGTQTYSLANIYGPNDDNPNFYLRVAALLESFQTDHTIIGGDFNFVMQPSIDSYNYAREYNTNAKRVFLNFTQSNDLVDIWRVRNPESSDHTWSRTNPIKSGRLDMFFINSHLISSTSDVKIKPGYRTDHSFVVLTLKTRNMERGPGIWKINNSILQDSEYINLVSETVKKTVFQYAIPVYEYEYATDPSNYKDVQFKIEDSLFYETLLMLIRGETLQYCKRKARNRRTKENELVERVQLAQNNFDTNKCDKNIRELEKAKNDLEEHRAPYVQGLIVRSRAQWHEEGERNSKYFLSLEKRNACRKTIQYIENDGKTLTTTGDVLSLFTENLRYKYSAQQELGPVDKKYIASNLANALTEQEAKELDKELSFEELSIAIQNMKKGKTPGSNGFSSDFFRVFWNILGIFLHRAFKTCCSKGESLATHRESLITLIPKSGQADNSIKGWRPISLLNVDFKIISTAIANRFKKVISRIISPTQTAYIKGRFIGENSRLVYDVISNINKTNKSGIIMAADFEAAFETVSWPYLRAVLNEMNFGKNFIKLINIMYLNNNNFSRILLNGFLGEKIYIHKGIRQGDPVSGYLFNIAVEILSKQITESKKLTGIKLNTATEVRISQYADDTILFLENSIRSLNGAAEELALFSAHSGLKLNWRKTSCLPINCQIHQRLLESNIAKSVKWVNELKILGIHFKSSLKHITEQNLDKKLENLENEIKQWNRRYITPIGKITVIKSLLVSKLVHLFTALPNPDHSYIKRIEQMLYRFLWCNKPDRIKRTKLIQSNQDDGLKMIDLTSFLNSLKLSWMKRLMCSTAQWVYVAKEEGIDPENLLVYGTVRLKHIANTINNHFWKDVLTSLIHLNQLLALSPEDILREPLWYSDFTKFKNSKITHWDERGLRFIGDLFNPITGNILSREEIKRQYRIAMTFLCYESLIRSLPSDVKTSNSITFLRPNIPNKLNMFNKSKVSKDCYAMFVLALREKCSITNEKLKTKWTRDIHFHAVGTLCEVKRSTKSPYLIYLHYRIITRTITTNKYLHTIQLSDSNTCTFCDRDVETIKHLFWECPVTQRFIQNIDRTLHSQYQIHFQHNEHSWFFPHELDELQIFLIILTKSVIYKARNTAEKPELKYMLSVLKMHAQQEQYSCKINNTIDAFNSKWKTLANIISQ